jgi:hypothetical protein
LPEGVGPVSGGGLPGELTPFTSFGGGEPDGGGGGLPVGLTPFP